MGKICRKCGEEKPLEEFYRAKAGLLGRMARCRKCYDAACRAYRERNWEACRARARVYDASPERRLARKLRAAGVVA